MTHDALDRLRKEWRERLWVLRHRDLSIAEFHAMQIPIADAMQSLLDALDAREADAKDAARYRWIVENAHKLDPHLFVWSNIPGDKLSPAIDAALRSGKEPA